MASTTKTSTTKASSTTKATTTAPATTAAPPAGITTALPASAGYTALPTASVITGSFDGKMVKFDRAGSSGDCQEQKETGEADAVFILESGASISNVIIGKAQAEGSNYALEVFLATDIDRSYRYPLSWAVHRDKCLVGGRLRRCHYCVFLFPHCTAHALSSVTSQIKQTGSGDVSTINGGGAFHAEDKVVQHNGAGLVKISNFFASDFGKLYRACGNCATHYERHVQLSNVCLNSGKEGVGINSNWGDTASLSGVKISGKPSAANVCCTYTGVNKGSEPPKIGCGDGYSACQYSESSVGSC
ncbi:hypothetical protein HGRIS_010671 [Hohenbuehelia grisea]|uniref:Pectate lyase n=1 Tax=Hohenbuehelia grisea TaxID=104357 RepID=A0ABR3IXF2_9AGAR